jgi:hypothetical protein
MITNGTALTFDVAGQTGPYMPRTVSDVRQTAIDNLTPYFDVVSVELKSKGFLEDPVHGILGVNWPYQATVSARVQADYADVRDVDSIVAHAFYEGAGELPTVTARELEHTPGPPESTTGISLTTAIVLVAVALVAVAVIKVS